jgi:hypothetical protein
MQIAELCPMPRDTLHKINRQIKHKTERQRFAKLKEVQANTQSQHLCTTFNFARPCQKPTHHPTNIQCLKNENTVKLTK